MVQHTDITEKNTAAKEKEMIYKANKAENNSRKDK